jgi:hypothetical protein
VRASGRSGPAALSSRRPHPPLLVPPRERRGAADRVEPDRTRLCLARDRPRRIALGARKLREVGRVEPGVGMRDEREPAPVLERGIQRQPFDLPQPGSTRPTGRCARRPRRRRAPGPPASRRSLSLSQHEAQGLSPAALLPPAVLSALLTSRRFGARGDVALVGMLAAGFGVGGAPGPGWPTSSPMAGCEGCSPPASRSLPSEL